MLNVLLQNYTSKWPQCKRNQRELHRICNVEVLVNKLVNIQKDIVCIVD